MSDLQSLVRQDLGTGLGLRNVHYQHILSKRPQVDFFEILSDNYMHTGGRPLQVLDQVAERYPIVMHSVGLNIGSVDPLDRAYVRELAALQQRCSARWISDHLCWTGVQGKGLHDLMPMPYTEAALKHLTKRVRQVQDQLQQPLILENPSTYLEFAHRDLDEPGFLAALCEETGCGLLLDVNNVFVSASNHGWDAEDYLRRVPWDHVVYFHLAGHTVHETHRLDTHDHPVCKEVWQLYRLAWNLSGGRSTLLEWDDRIPDFATTHREAKKALKHRAPLAAAAPPKARRRVGAAS
ncbi:MAG: DUF692 domain-containing protein [Planctomycetota bacterium]